MQNSHPSGPGASVRLEDRREISRLFHEYAWHFDHNEPGEVAELFTSDAVIDYGPELEPIRGREAIAPRISAGLDQIFEATSHHVSNISIDFECSDAASAVAYVYAWHKYRDGSPDGYLWGQYHNRVRRTAEGWRFTELVLKASGTKEFHRPTMHPIGRRGVS